MTIFNNKTACVCETSYFHSFNICNNKYLIQLNVEINDCIYHYSIKKRAYSHESNNLRSRRRQYGFHIGKSTEDAIHLTN